MGHSGQYHPVLSKGSYLYGPLKLDFGSILKQGYRDISTISLLHPRDLE